MWSSAPAAVAFTLRPYFWQTRPFLAVAGLALAALAFGAHRVRVRAVARSMREEMLRELSLHDELTGLHNRRGLMALAEQHVRSMARTQRGFAIVFIDMDGMKHINDTLGHAEGDRALVDVAALLRLTFRESDIAARIGGDEFAVLVRDDGERPKEGPDAASARLRNAVSAAQRHRRAALPAVAQHRPLSVRPGVAGAARGGDGRSRPDDVRGQAAEGGRALTARSHGWAGAPLTAERLH